MKKNKCPNILVVSHNCFSKTGSNGRTLGNFFIDWPKESIAQFYINNEIPDSLSCDNYFRVTDIEALKAFYKGSKAGEIIKKEMRIQNKKDEPLEKIYKKHRKKTSFNYIARNLIWNSNRWKSEGFEKWIDEFNPDILLIQLGDYAFMLRIALEIAKKRNIPLIIYNSEDYYFKDKKSLSPFYDYYRYDYKKQIRELISYASHSIYNSTMLEETYQKEFVHESSVIMTSTDISPYENKKGNSPMKVSYLGNLGVGRYESLIEIAEVLQKLNSEIYLDIYGKMPNEEIEFFLKSCKGIRLKGFVSYDEVVNVMKSSDILIHAENFSEFYKWDLKHAFSTKIADTLASGIPFFVYAPQELASIKYLKSNQLAHVATNKKEMESILKEILYNILKRKEFITNALKIKEINHDIEKNKNKIKQIFKKAI